MCIHTLARTCAHTHVKASLLSWLDGCPPWGYNAVSEPGNGFYVVLPVCHDKILTTKHIYYIVEIDFLQKCLAISILFLNFAPNISSVVFSCTMVLIVCLHLSLLSTGGFFYTLSPVPPYPRCNPGVPGGGLTIPIFGTVLWVSLKNSVFFCGNGYF